MKPYYTLADLLDEENPFDADEPVAAGLAVIGYPIDHSKSPAMQQAALDAAGIKARYIRIQASPEEFADVVRLIRDKGFIGANVTVPHKQAPARSATKRMPCPAPRGRSTHSSSRKTAPSPGSIRTAPVFPEPSGKNSPWTSGI